MWKHVESNEEQYIFLHVDNTKHAFLARDDKYSVDAASYNQNKNQEFNASSRLIIMRMQIPFHIK